MEVGAVVRASESRAQTGPPVRGLGPFGPYRPSRPRARTGCESGGPGADETSAMRKHMKARARSTFSAGDPHRISFSPSLGSGDRWARSMKMSESTSRLGAGK